MNINIISTGSSGNAYLYNNSILIDVGLPYKYLKEYAKQIKIVLLSHIHGDHFNKTSIRKIYIENEDIKFCCGEFLLDDLLNIGIDKNRITVISAGKKYELGDVTFSPVILQHDVSNFGYRLMKENYKILHATDCSNLNGITAKNYDVAVLEANHHLETALKIIKKKKENGEFSHLDKAIRTHLSVQKSVEFIKKNNIKEYIPVHMGSSTSNEVKKYIENKIGE